MAILSSHDKKLVLSDIYQWILDNYNYFRTRGPGWRNSIRHNLSLNDCFIKAGRSANGKGHYWAIHPANLEDFQKGDFRRRRAQRRVRKHMGLTVPDDDDNDSPSPSPLPQQPVVNWASKSIAENLSIVETSINANIKQHLHTVHGTDFIEPIATHHLEHKETQNDSVNVPPLQRNRRLFDMESILAPEPGNQKKRFLEHSDSTQFVQQINIHDGKNETEENRNHDVDHNKFTERNFVNQLREISNSSEEENISDGESWSNNERVKLPDSKNVERNISNARNNGTDNGNIGNTMPGCGSGNYMGGERDISTSQKNQNKVVDRNCSSAPLLFENAACAVNLSKVSNPLDQSTKNYVPQNSQVLCEIQSVVDIQKAMALSSHDRRASRSISSRFSSYPYLIGHFPRQHIDGQTWHQPMANLLLKAIITDSQTHVFQKDEMS